MKKKKLILQLKENYSSFTSFIDSLSEEDYDLSTNGKWSAGEHLGHLVLSVSPLVGAFQMDKKVLIEQFGTSPLLMRSYDVMKALYLDKLGSGGKAPKRFDPAFNEQENRTVLCNTLTSLIEKLSLTLKEFSEEDLDQLSLPHPLLGNISLREMLYNSIYHCQHHQNLVSKALKSF